MAQETTGLVKLTVTKDTLRTSKAGRYLKY